MLPFIIHQKKIQELERNKKKLANNFKLSDEIFIMALIVFVPKYK